MWAYSFSEGIYFLLFAIIYVALRIASAMGDPSGPDLTVSNGASFIYAFKTRNSHLAYFIGLWEVCLVMINRRAKILFYNV